MTDYLKTREAAEEAGFTENYVHILIRKGKVKAEFKGRQYWVDAADLRRYVGVEDALRSQRFNWRRTDEN
jgi:formylmethanofuran dehydrogenase subunit A